MFYPGTFRRIATPTLKLIVNDSSSHLGRYASDLITEENQTQRVRVNLNLLTHILTKRKSFCFVVFSLPLQDLNFVRKELQVFMEDSQT